MGETKQLSPGTRRRWASGFWLFAWTMLFVSGIGACKDITGQGVSGFPNQGQFALYLYWPGAMALANLVMLLLARRTPPGYFVAAMLLQLPVAGLLLAFWQGGI